jgi:hypothetical protein
MLISHYCSFRTVERCSCGIIACLHFCLNINMTILTFKLALFVVVSGVECSIPPRYIDSTNAGEHELDLDYMAFSYYTLYF